MSTQEDLKSIKRLCILNFAEIQHLKKLMSKNIDISKDDINDYANSLKDYIREMESKYKNLIKDFPDM